MMAGSQEKSFSERNELYKKNFLENPQSIKDSICLVKQFLMHRKITDCLGKYDNYIFSDRDKCELVDQFYEDVKNCANDKIYYYLYEAAEELNHTYLCDILSDNLTKLKSFGLEYTAAILETIDLSENIKPINEEILVRCRAKNLCSNADKDRLSRELDREGPTIAFFFLIELLKKRHPEWYLYFFEVLVETKNVDAIKVLDPILVKELEAKNCLEEGYEDNLRNEIKLYFKQLYRLHFDLDSDAEIEEEEEGESFPVIATDHVDTEAPEQLGACAMPSPIKYNNSKCVTESPKKLQSKTENPLNFTWDSFLSFEDDQISESKVEKVSFELRPYQRELAERAIRGENVIICAPTGSGKTHVAAKIAQEHLINHLDDEKWKVAFLVHRVNLVAQQHSLFDQLLSQSDIKVSKFSGGSGVSDGASVPIKYAMMDCQVMVLTADILLNALNTDDEMTKLESLDVLSLIIFDECHNCTKNHPYNKIMVQYFSDKKDKRKVPQIVGLTASPGTNKANNLKTAFDHLVTLCANMDAYFIQTVRNEDNLRNLTELNKNPEDKVISSKRRDPDVCEEELNRLMGICEMILMKLYNDKRIFDPKYDVSKFVRAPENRGQSIYTNFVGKLATLHTMAIQEPDDYRNSAYCIYKYLNIYDRAFKLNRLFREIDTANYIKEELEVESPNFKPTCPLDQFLMNKLINSPIVQRFEIEVKNPALEDLKREIVKQLDEIPDSRIIVFLKQRVYTQLIKNYFMDDEDLREIPSDLIVGANAGLDEGGATKVWQREVLLKFKDGTNKVLFSTTVAEEGLDVVKCNLVIRYGHITNETAMIQSKGRARAELSKYILIVPFGEEWQRRKEQVNLYREDLMNAAIKKFTSMNDERRKDKIRSAQVAAECERKLEVRARKKKQTNNDGMVFDLYCIRCNNFFCKSQDFRLAQNIHRFMVNVEYYNKLKIIETKNPPRSVGTMGEFLVGDKITCGKCGQDFGMIGIFKHVAYPVISICNFSLRDENGCVRTVKKWKDAPFNVLNLTTDEIHERSVNFGNDWIATNFYDP